MSSPHYTAIETYGSQRVTFAGQSIGAYKIGYSTVGKAVLLNLYGSTARDVTSKHASYHYVQLTGATCVHQGYLVLALNETEFAQVQQITRSHPTRRSGLWYWQERQWRHFPYAETAEFTLPLGRGGPTFDPMRLRVVSPSQNTPVETAESIHAEYVQRSPTEDGWWWLSGNTYPHREFLKQHRLRWSAKRQQWYFIGKILPSAVQALITDQTQTNRPLEPVSPLLDIFGGRIIGKERSTNGEITVKGENGVFATQTTMINRLERHQTLWLFDLPPLFRTNYQSHIVTAALQRNGAVNSVYNQQWRFESAEKVAAMDTLADSIPFTNTLPKTTTVKAIPTDDAPCSDEEAERILGVKLAPKLETPSVKSPLQEHRFVLGQTIYLATSLRVEKDRKLKMDTCGKIIRRYMFKKTPDYRHQLAYGVDFGEHGMVTLFQDSLADTPYDIPGIERHEVISIMFGVSAEQGIMAEVDRRQRISQEYTVLDELPVEELQPTPKPLYTPGQAVFIQTGRGLPTEAVMVLQSYPACLNAHQKLETGYRVQGGAGEYTVFESELTPEPPLPSIEIQVLESPEERRRTERYWQTVEAARGGIGTTNTGSPETLPSDRPAEAPTPPPPAIIPLLPTPEPPPDSPLTPPPTIRVSAPLPIPTDGSPLNEVQTAVVHAKTQPTPALPLLTATKHRLKLIGQSYVGELTGSITGNVYCFGYAIHAGICVFVNMGGPRMAVEAIRAKFSKGEIVNCVPWNAPAVELTAGEGNTGMYHDYMQNIPEAKFTSLILCHDLLVNPNYGGQSTTFILRTDTAQAAAKLKHHVTELVNVPVFDEWTHYLYHAGQTARLVRATRSAGDLDLLQINLDRERWTQLVTSGLEQGVIQLPTGV